MYTREQLKDEIGNFRTLSLFLETNVTSHTALFTLKDDDYEKDGVQYLSLKRLYLSYDDPTEWEFVMAVFGNWRHWQRIIGNKILFSYIEQWRDEQEIKLRSKGIKSLVRMSKDKDSAAKWLAEGAWKGKRGRPSKAEIEREKKIQANIVKDLDEHWDRLMKEENGDRLPN
jgi:hypothetical protein